MRLEKGLVSIGLPTYNRPAGLRRTLSQLTGQSYPRLEIIVSDNASPGDETARVVEEFALEDRRIRYIRQPTNQGAAANFRFVLGEARGEFFMWAADDDEWHGEFVSKCLQNIGCASSVVPNCSVLYRGVPRREQVTLPLLDPSAGVFLNLRQFLTGMLPGFIYGLHRRESLNWVMKEVQFDWWDCYFVARTITEGGFKTFRETLFTLGIDGQSYALKPFSPRKGRLFRYRPFLFKTGALVLRNADLSIGQKLCLLNVMADYMMKAFKQYEVDHRARQVAIVSKLWAIKEGFIRRALQVEEGGRGS